MVQIAVKSRVKFGVEWGQKFWSEAGEISGEKPSELIYRGADWGEKWRSDEPFKRPYRSSKMAPPQAPRPRRLALSPAQKRS
jgi:hypothetical protein